MVNHIAEWGEAPKPDAEEKSQLDTHCKEHRQSYHRRNVGQINQKSRAHICVKYRRDVPEESGGALIFRNIIHTERENLQNMHSDSESRCPILKDIVLFVKNEETHPRADMSLNQYTTKWGLGFLRIF